MIDLIIERVRQRLSSGEESVATAEHLLWGSRYLQFISEEVRANFYAFKLGWGWMVK